MKKQTSLLVFLFCFVSFNLFAQIEMTSPSHPVYDFLRKMQLKGVIPQYNPANIPISRGKIASLLMKIIENEKYLTHLDKEFLKDYKVEYYYDIFGTLEKSNPIFGNSTDNSFFRDSKQNAVYSFADSNASFFADGTFRISQRASSGDSIGSNSIALGEAGFKLRGTLFNTLGFYLRASNGQKINGKSQDVIFAYQTDPVLRANTKFVYEQKNFDTFEGYLRYQTPKDWLSLTVGREAVYQGFGYIDRIFLSKNTVPFDMIKLDLSYKSLSYSYFYGMLKGDSLGTQINWKNIATHRLDLKFSNKVKAGFFESIITTNNPFSLNLINPVSFLISADLNSGVTNTYANNSLLGFDIEINPMKNLGFQSTILIDDLNISTLFNIDQTSNDNKFGYQVGVKWYEAFNVPNIDLSVEYTRLDPFVYSHRDNKNGYTNYNLSLGHELSPNSDEIAANANINISSRINLQFLVQYQRSGEGFIYDNQGNIIGNYGGDINRGDFDKLLSNKFLQGNRVNKTIITFFASFQPVRQLFLDLKYLLKYSNAEFIQKTFNDSYYWATLRIDY
ncbi:hypothetical protein BH10BAC5_BH10BAC5_14440 [soil metagenome]